jgi:hypothetical protein
MPGSPALQRAPIEHIEEKVSAQGKVAEGALGAHHLFACARD